MRNERQEIYCHECNNYVQFVIDLELNGNHVLKCPKCGHEHCRVVRNGIITDDRWDSRNGAAIYVSRYTITYSTNSYATTSSFGTATNAFIFASAGTSVA
jgi:uncharacterized Zn finger protein